MSHHAAPRLLLKLGEVFLKGRNRRTFLDLLEGHVRRRLPAGARLVADATRLFIDADDAASRHAAVGVACDTPGVQRVTEVVAGPLEPDALAAVALELARRRWGRAPGAFAVRVNRLDKRYPLSSNALAARVGAHLAQALERPVDLGSPRFRVDVEVARDGVWLSVDHLDGLGGLPVGTAGRALLLLSGGIDSPVAGSLAQKRGCVLDAVYFHAPPWVGEQARERAADLARRLAPRQGPLALHVVRFTEAAVAVRDHVDPHAAVVVQRRLMWRIAGRLGALLGVQALVSGDDLGQVASQSLANLAHLEGLTPLPTLRPLITADKADTIALARRLGTFDISTRPHPDCCAVLAPASASPRVPAWLVEREEARLSVHALVQDATWETLVL